MSLKLSTAMLSYCRSLEIATARMFGLSSSDSDRKQKPVVVQVEGVRGQSSHANDKKGNAGKSNIQRIDVARMPLDCDILGISFSMRVLPNSLAPAASDDGAVRDALAEVMTNYGKAGGFEVLAARYVENIANGRFAWRNRTLSDAATVRVEWRGQSVAFDPFALPLDEIAGTEAVKAAVVEGDTASVDDLISLIAHGLSKAPVTLNVVWEGQVAPLAEVHPSQEYTGSDDIKAPEGKVSRVLASVSGVYRGQDIRHAVMHGQKIGAAIRCIDDWHGVVGFGPVPVNAYAGVQEAGVVLRHPGVGAKSFYDIVKKPAAVIDAIARGELDGDCHFFAANLVRGGVIGSK